jgi:hypothetical protein
MAEEPPPDMRVVLQRRLQILANEVEALEDQLRNASDFTDAERSEIAAELLVAQGNLEALRDVVRGLDD